MLQLFSPADVISYVNNLGKWIGTHGAEVQVRAAWLAEQVHQLAFDMGDGGRRADQARTGQKLYFYSVVS